MFNAVVDSRQIIDDASTTKDICIDDNLFSDEDIEDDSKQVIDSILKDINHSEILIQYKPKITTTTTIKNEPESFNFKDTSLTKKRKNSRYLPRAELSIKSIKNLDKRKMLSESSSENDIEFIKLVP